MKIRSKLQFVVPDVCKLKFDNCQGCGLYREIMVEPAEYKDDWTREFEIFDEGKIPQLKIDID